MHPGNRGNKASLPPPLLLVLNLPTPGLCLLLTVQIAVITAVLKADVLPKISFPVLCLSLDHHPVGTTAG